MVDHLDLDQVGQNSLDSQKHNNTFIAAIYKKWNQILVFFLAFYFSHPVRDSERILFKGADIPLGEGPLLKIILKNSFLILYTCLFREKKGLDMKIVTICCKCGLMEKALCPN